MKKLYAFVLSLALVLSLAACAEKTSVSQSVSEVSTETSVSTETKTEPVAEDKGLGIDKDIIVLYVNDVHCGIDDNLGYQDLVTVKNAYERYSNPLYR